MLPLRIVFRPIVTILAVLLALSCPASRMGVLFQHGYFPARFCHKGSGGKPGKPASNYDDFFRQAVR